MNIKLNLQGAKKAASGHPHVSVKDLEHFKALPPAGEFVRLQDAMGNFLAHAVSDGPRAVIPYRVLSRERHPEFNAAWFATAVENALRLRRGMMQENTGLRLLHGEADSLPGVFCDRHAAALLLDIQSPGLAVHGPAIEAALWEQAGGKSLWRRLGAGWERVKGETAGPALQSQVAGLKFMVHLDEADPSDFDLEQRMNYARLGELKLKGQALVAFSRKGAWVAAALRAGCDQVVALERDSAANIRAAENLALNGFEKRAEFVQGDGLERLDKLAASGKKFGFILADMPGKSKGSRLNFQAARHGAGLVARCLSMLEPDGVAAFCLAAGELSAQGFQNALQRGADEAKVGFEIVAAGRPGPDFPELTGFEHPSLRRFLAMKTKALA